MQCATARTRTNINGEEKALFEAFDESQTFFKVIVGRVRWSQQKQTIFYGFVGKAHTLLSHVHHMTSTSSYTWINSLSIMVTIRYWELKEFFPPKVLLLFRDPYICKIATHGGDEADSLSVVLCRSMVNQVCPQTFRELRLGMWMFCTFLWIEAMSSEI